MCLDIVAQVIEVEAAELIAAVWKLRRISTGRM